MNGNRAERRLLIGFLGLGGVSAIGGSIGLLTDTLQMKQASWTARRSAASRSRP
ncbi:MAG: hypothetical protein R3A46_12295 [Thermomicrobiales bacterium]